MFRRPLITRPALLLTLGATPLLSLPSVVGAQHDGGAPPRTQSAAPREASQFAFLVGQWDVSVMPKVSSLAARIHGAPKLKGSWKAWRAFDGFGVEDELRIFDRSGNPTSLTHAMRFYDAAQGHWTQSMLDVYRARFSSASGDFKGGEMTLVSQGVDAEGKPLTNRSRFYDITAQGFKWQSDRSSDGGRTWETAVLRMEATRVAAVAPR
jgi:hypothetical protein